MSNYEQCRRCRLDEHDCGFSDHDSNRYCQHYEKPINNSKKFGRLLLFTGRVGRLEYALTLVIAIVLYFLVMVLMSNVLRLLGVYITTPAGIYIFTFGCMLPSVYLAIAAGVKRANDTRVSKWYALVPLIPLFFLNVFTFIVMCVGGIYLFKDPGEEGVNEHGSNPAQPYDEQIDLLNL